MNFEPVTPQNAEKLRPYYINCDYRLCEYSVGVKLMWGSVLRPAFCEAAGCLIVRNEIDGRWQFDFPVAGPEGDVEAALTLIERYCTEQGVRPVISVVPEQEASRLFLRYPVVRLINERPWKDYIYRRMDLAEFAGRHYSGQRNHINKFRRDFPDAEFTPLTDPQDPRLAAFWRDYEAEFHKTGPLAVQELALAQEMFSRIGTGWFCAGGMMAEGRLVAVCLAEKCGGTLVNHIEKALYSHAGAYPALVQAFADHYGGDCQWCNREDDARDKGLRTSKLQYLPEALAGKVRMEVGTELDALKAVPTLKTERLTLTPLRKADIPAYNALCLDDERNRWWGYDYRTDLGDKPLTDTYFYDDARADFPPRPELRRPAEGQAHRRGGALPPGLPGRLRAGLPHRAGIRRSRLRHGGLRRRRGLGAVPSGACPGGGQVLQGERAVPEDAGLLHAPQRGGRDVFPL